jgi:hypothetical protein
MSYDSDEGEEEEQQAEQGEEDDVSDEGEGELDEQVQQAIRDMEEAEKVPEWRGLDDWSTKRLMVGEWGTFWRGACMECGA